MASPEHFKDRVFFDEPRSLAPSDYAGAVVPYVSGKQHAMFDCRHRRYVLGLAMDYALEEYQRGISWSEISRRIQMRFPGVDPEPLREKLGW